MMMADMGRPEIGPAFSVRFPVDLVRSVDAAAAKEAVSRAGWLRWAAEEQLAYPREVLATLADWMYQEGMAADIGYAMEKPWKHQDFIFCAQHQIDAAQMDELGQRCRDALEHADELPAGWRVEQTSPLDYRVVCGHDTVVYASDADRDQVNLASCPHGCPAHDPAAVLASLSTQTSRGGTKGLPQ